MYLFISHLCVYLCLYVFCIGIGSIFIYIYVFLVFCTCIHVSFVGTDVVSFHCVSPIFFCYWPFADAIYCALCSVYIILCVMLNLLLILVPPLVYNDLLIY